MIIFSELFYWYVHIILFMFKSTINKINNSHLVPRKLLIKYNNFIVVQYKRMLHYHLYMITKEISKTRLHCIDFLNTNLSIN